jgi:1,4-alpha-glucan branching enzyme
MGAEIGQTSEWRHDQSLDWHLLQYGYHEGVQNLVRDINKIYRETPALYTRAFEQSGFEWIDYSDTENSIMAFARLGEEDDDIVVAVCNFTPQLHYNYRLGVPRAGEWVEIFNSDDKKYSGTGLRNDKVHSSPTPLHGRDQSIDIKLPPLGITLLAYKKE